MDDALQILYDNLTSGAYDPSGQLFSMISTLGRDSSDKWDHVGAWLVDGIRHGDISARGRLGIRSKLDILPTAIDTGGAKELLEHCVEDDQGRIWEIVEVRRASIDLYLKRLADT